MSLKQLTELEIKSVEISILKEIDSICGLNSLNYNIMYGTLLGAVRHKGFIPWDDDIDIIMPREDYESLLSIIKNNQCTPEWLEIIDSSVDGCYLPFAKAVDNRTIAKMDDCITEFGIWVDIFPIDNVPQNAFLSRCYIDLCLLFRETILAVTTHEITLSKGETENRYRKRIRFLRKLGNAVGKKKLCSIYLKTISLFRKKPSGYVANLWPSYRYREVFESNTLFEQSDILFEDTYFKGPLHFDAILSQLYGDYKTLPPLEKRRTHRITAWEKSG